MRRRFLRKPGIGRTQRSFPSHPARQFRKQKRTLWVHLVLEMVSREGFEPSTPSLRGSCSNQLSYRPAHLVYYTKVLAFWQGLDWRVVVYNTSMDIVWFILGAIVIIAVFLFLLAAFTGAPYVPSTVAELEKAFENLYPLSKKDLLIDLGSGDGVVLRVATKYGAKAIGVEINPLLAWLSKMRLRKNTNIRIVCKNFFKYNFPPETSVVYAFGDSRDIDKIAALVAKQAQKIGHPIYFISNAFKLRNRHYLKQHRAYYLYKIGGNNED